MLCFRIQLRIPGYRANNFMHFTLLPITLRDLEMLSSVLP
jgi:hypothetical protein